MSEVDTVFNFVFPVKELSGHDFVLEPFVTEKHALAYWEATDTTSDLYSYLTFGPFASIEDFLRDVVDRLAADSTVQLYAIMTTRKPKSDAFKGYSAAGSVLAGITGYYSASRIHRKSEIGPIILLPQFRGMGLAPDVVELQVQHAFKDSTDGGFGIWRVEWTASTSNVASIKLAQKMKFRHEGTMKWEKFFPNGLERGKIGNGRPVPTSANAGDIGRDTVMYARCWDDENQS